MNYDQILAMIFGIAVGVTLLIGAGIGLLFRWVMS